MPGPKEWDLEPYGRLCVSGARTSQLLETEWITLVILVTAWLNVFGGAVLCMCFNYLLRVLETREYGATMFICEAR